jgi:hypothetical protein
MAGTIQQQAKMTELVEKRTRDQAYLRELQKAGAQNPRRQRADLVRDKLADIERTNAEIDRLKADISAGKADVDRGIYIGA